MYSARNSGWIRRSAVATCLALTYSVVALAQNTRGLDVLPRRNPNASFMIRMWLAHDKDVFVKGEKVTVRFRSERDCYVYFFNVDPAGKVTMLFPNRFDGDNLVAAQEELVIPGPTHSFDWVVRPPFGEEYVVAIATTEPIPEANKIVPFGPDGFFKSPLSKGLEVMRRLHQQAARELGHNNWNSSYVRFTTVPQQSDTSQVQRPHKRVAVIIGVGTYKYDGIPDLKCVITDVYAMRKALTEYCDFQVDDDFVLLDQQVTRPNIDNLFKRLEASTRPGDLVLIYWSGHAGRAADLDGDEQNDNYDEYFALHDTIQNGSDEPSLPPRNVLLDDEFFQYLTELDGRKLILVIDTCYAASTTKGLGPDSIKARRKKIAPRGRNSLPWMEFLHRDVLRTKDLGRNDVVLLAACPEYEKARGGLKMSIFTSYLYDVIKEYHDGIVGGTYSTPLTVEMAYKQIVARMSDDLQVGQLRRQQQPVLDGDLLDAELVPLETN